MAKAQTGIQSRTRYIEKGCHGNCFLINFESKVAEETVFSGPVPEVFF